MAQLNSALTWTRKPTMHFEVKSIQPKFIFIVMIMALNLGYNAWLS